MTAQKPTKSNKDTVSKYETEKYEKWRVNSEKKKKTPENENNQLPLQFNVLLTE